MLVFLVLVFVVGNDGDGFGLLTKPNMQCPKFKIIDPDHIFSNPDQF